MADQIDGGLGNYSTARCLPGGVPRMMVAFEPQEYIITPHTTYILIGENDHYHRIFTDGRSWPSEIEPTFAGYSNGSMRTATTATTRSKSRRAVLSRVHVLTTQVDRLCTFTINPRSGNASYVLSADGLLMPTRKDQPRRTCDISNSRGNSDDRSDTHRASRRGGLIALGRDRTIPRTSACKVASFTSYAARATH
jgi:hypothetical protein